MAADPPLSPAQGAPALPTPGVANLRPQTGIHFTVDNVGPPSPLYIGPGEALFVSALNISAAAQTITINYRLMLPNGIIVPGSEQFIAAANRVQTAKTFVLQEGFLLSLELLNGTSQRGNVFVGAFINKGAAFNVQAIYLLCQGYTTSQAPVGWPVIRPDYPQNKPGLITFNTVANPAAGADWTYTVGAGGAVGSRQRIIAITAKLVTSAAVATRQVVLAVKSGATLLWEIAAGATQLASLTQTYNFGPGAPTQTTVIATTLSTGLPVDFSLGNGFTISSVTTAIDVADQWSAIAVTVEDNIEF